MSKLIWHQPRYELSHHLSLVINSFDGNKNLLETENKTEAMKVTDRDNMGFLDTSRKKYRCAAVCWHLSERTGCNDKVHPLHSEASAELDGLNMTFSCPGKGREEEAHAEGIINITESINKGGIPATKKKKGEATQFN